MWAFSELLPYELDSAVSGVKVIMLLYEDSILMARGDFYFSMLHISYRKKHMTICDSGWEHFRIGYKGKKAKVVALEERYWSYLFYNSFPAVGGLGAVSYYLLEVWISLNHEMWTWMMLHQCRDRGYWRSLQPMLIADCPASAESYNAVLLPCGH